MSNQTSWQSASWSSVISTHHTLYIFGCNLLFKLYYRLWHELFCRYENSFSIAFKRLVHPKKENSLIIYWPSWRFFFMLLVSMQWKKMWTDAVKLQICKKAQQNFHKIYSLALYFNLSSEAIRWLCVMNGHINSAEHHRFLCLVTLWFDFIRSGI